MRKTEWSNQHEEIFSKLNKRSYTSSSLAKSMTFQDLKKALPKNLDYLDKKWKYDRNSPWVVDLDHNSAKPWVVKSNMNIGLAKNTLSNINVAQNIDLHTIDETDTLREELA